MGPSRSRRLPRALLKPLSRGLQVHPSQVPALFDGRAKTTWKSKTDQLPSSAV